MDKKLQELLHASSALAEEKDLNQILVLLANVTRSLLEADRATIFLHDVKTNELWSIVAHGVGEIRLPSNAGIAGFVYTTGEVLNIEDAYEDSRFNPQTDKDSGYRTKSMLAYPLKNRDGITLGVFQIINKQNSPTFHEGDIQLLQHLSLYVASTVENAVLQDQLQKAQQDAIYKLSHATRYKDPETQNHIIRVGMYAHELAKEIGMSTQEQEMVRLAAPMHDIGKVGIPDAILQKPGRLTLEEWQIMKKHAIYGYEILKSEKSDLMKMAAMVSLDHHEKWNGTGYPNRKKGEEISLVGRLTAISDVFDALTSSRCYKEAWSYDKSIEIIKSESGSHFEPKLVEAFTANLPRMIQIREEYEDE